ncbi:MAG: TonB family protein [Thermoanaerobaculia bacterium]
MFEMASVLEGPASSKRQVAALAAFTHLGVATVLVAALFWRIDAVDPVTLTEAFILPISFAPVEWSPKPPQAKRAETPTTPVTPPKIVQPKDVTDLPAAGLESQSIEPIGTADPGTTGSTTGDPNAIPGSDSSGPSGIADPVASRMFDPVHMVAPVVLYRIDPVFPEMARRTHRQGSVVVEAEIATDGSLRSARVVSSPLGAGLEESALAAVRNWRFAPARYGDRPISVYYRWNIVFSLR